MSINASRVRDLLAAGDFRTLFLEELGWDHACGEITIVSRGQTGTLQLIAEKRGVQVFVCPPDQNGRIPSADIRSAIDRELVKRAHEHLLIFTASDRTEHLWVYPRREPGRPARLITYRFDQATSNELLIQKLASIRFILSEEEELNLIEVTQRLRESLDRDSLTRSFYQRFERERNAFEGFIRGIPDGELARWYVAVLVNRLMFVYFIQEKGFLDGNQRYLQSKLMGNGGSYYRDFLCPLFFEGFALPEDSRPTGTRELLGRVPYLNGGIFQRHQVEELYGKTIEIPDEAFQRLFAFFDDYRWHLDERPLVAGNEINPDVLGYIFEKYVNQKQMGAYYTKEDITDYISRSTVIPFLLDAARAECKVAFDNPDGPTVWDLLRDDPTRYIYPAVRHGTEQSLPEEISVGMNPPTLEKTVEGSPAQTVELRRTWNKPAPGGHGLPTEWWREVVARRTRLAQVRHVLLAGDVRDASTLVSLNLDVRQFAQDLIENCEGPELLRAMWRAIESVTVLDPTCGSGAFLFAALNTLEPLYEACLDRMEAFIDDLELVGEVHAAEKYPDFRRVLSRVAEHPNRRYFVFKSIILSNLFGVDVMEEAVEICKLRLFLKLASQVEPNVGHANFGIEPLPDVDFNIKAGNSLVGFATYQDAERAIASRLDFDNVLKTISARASSLEQAFDAFRRCQIESDGQVSAKEKLQLQTELNELREEMNRYLATRYGVKSDDVDRYSCWLTSHQPFHWFVEFFGIMNRGGFDVILGNPPYVETRNVDGYRVIDLETEECRDLYAYVLERSLALSGDSSMLGFIVPMSCFSVERFASLQRLLTSRSSSLFISNWSGDAHPSRLFEGVDKRLEIVIAKRNNNGHGPSEVYASKYLKWYAEERPVLFSLQPTYKQSRSPSFFPATLMKLGLPIEQSIVAKLRTASRTIGTMSVPRGSHIVFYTRKVSFFLQFLDFIPEVRDDKGRAREPSELKRLFFPDETSATLALACLSSSLFYWFNIINSDCRNLNKREIEAFRVPSGLAEQDIAALGSVTRRLMTDYKQNSENRTVSYQDVGDVTVQYFNFRPSKPIIDEIDHLLAPHYGLSEEELDFIVNYDVKYRMGRESGGDDE